MLISTNISHLLPDEIFVLLCTHPRIVLQNIIHVGQSKIIIEQTWYYMSCHKTFKDNFTLQKYVCKTCEPLGKRLFHYLIKHWQKEAADPPSSHKREKCAVDKDNILSSAAFTAASNYLMALHTDSQQMEFYIKVFIYSSYHFMHV